MNKTHQKRSILCFRFSASYLAPYRQSWTSFRTCVCLASSKAREVQWCSCLELGEERQPQNRMNKNFWGKFPFQGSRRGERTLYFTVQSKGKELSSGYLRVNGEKQTI